jgi:hypothetical protein
MCEHFTDASRNGLTAGSECIIEASELGFVDGEKEAQITTD